MLLDCGDPCMTLARRKSAKGSHISGGFSNEPPSENLSSPKTTLTALSVDSKPPSWTRKGLDEGHITSGYSPRGCSSSYYRPRAVRNQAEYPFGVSYRICFYPTNINSVLNIKIKRNRWIVHCKSNTRSSLVPPPACVIPPRHPNSIISFLFLIPILIFFVGDRSVDVFITRSWSKLAV